MTSEPKAPARQYHPAERLLLDIAPLAVFFIGNATHGIIFGTAAFMVAIIVSMIVSKWRFGKISPLLWISGIMVIVFGSLTIWFADKRFIQFKPTIYYATLAGLLFFGQATGRPMLKLVLEQAYPGLTARGWSLLSRNWGWFFVAMAIGNEIVRHVLSFDAWLLYKLWGVMPMTVLFAASQIPMLLRHGLSDDAKTIAVPEGD
jgi:intracellular septation protein